MAETPSCNDAEWDLARKILLQFISIATNPPESVYPTCNDGMRQLYSKILVTFQYIE